MRERERERESCAHSQTMAEVGGLIGGAILGAVFGELLKLVVKEGSRTIHFKKTFARLRTTLEALSPVIKELEKHNAHLGRRKEELDSLRRLMLEGKQLVLQCSEIGRLNFTLKSLYGKDLEVLISTLERFITIDLPVQTARDQKESLIKVTRMLSILEKPYWSWMFKAGQDLTASSSQIYHSTTTATATATAITTATRASFAGHTIQEYVLNVTVLSAGDLPALDCFGKSDPFVVLTLVKEKSETTVEKKTKVVKNSLDPVWNQTFDFDADDGLHDVLIVEVWDKDTLGKDYIGRCILPLAKVKLEGEYKKRFKLVGAKSGYLNLHLKWMPQPIRGDPKFLLHDMEVKPVGGILKVKLLQAKELPKKKIWIQKPDPCAVLYIQSFCDKMKNSKKISKDLCPIWNESFEFIIKEAEHLIVQVYDSEHLRSSKLIGCAQIRLSELQPGKVKYVWSKLVKDLEIQRDNKNIGQVHLELLYCRFGMENSFTNPIAPLEKVLKSSTTEVEANGSESAVTQEKNEVFIRGVLSVTVISAEDLPALDFMGKSDPYVVLALKKAETKNQTRVVKDNLNPVWDQNFDFVVKDGLHEMVIVEVWDKDPFGKDDYMGRCILSLTKVILEGEYKERFELVGTKSGYLNLHLKWMHQPVHPNA